MTTGVCKIGRKVGSLSLYVNERHLRPCEFNSRSVEALFRHGISL